MAKVRKAVIPAAGLGTRFLPATKAIPKEMLPIIDVPMIQIIIEEAVQSGIRDIVLITSKNKESVEKHFQNNPELEEYLERTGKPDLAKISKDLGKYCNLIPVEQEDPKGLGHAVLMAAEVIGNEPFAILLGDDLIDAKVPCTRQLIEVFEKTGSSVVGVMEVASAEVSKYGIIGGKSIQDGLWQVDRVIEKPQPKDAPTRMAIPGRYVVSATIFNYLKEVKPGKNGEIQLTDALEMMAKKEKLLAYRFEGQRYDAGDRLGFFEAQVAYGMKRPELRQGMIEVMKKHLQKG